MAERETIFTLEATPIKFGAGAVDDAGWEARARDAPRAAGHGPRSSRPGTPTACAARSRARASRSCLGTARGWSRRSTPSARRRRSPGDGARRRVRLGRRRLEHRHREGRRPRRLPPRRRHGVRQRAGRRGPQADGPLLPHLAIPTTGGLGLGGHDGRGPRPPRPRGEVRDLAPLPAARAGDRRPRAARDARRRGRSATGLDVVCHAAESFLAKPFDARPRPATPDDRPPYQGATPSRTSGAPRRSSAAGGTCAARSPTRGTWRRAAR
jgi:hypothetical protein